MAVKGAVFRRVSATLLPASPAGVLGPGSGEPSSIVWFYHSHIMAEDEINLGLIGTIIVTTASKICLSENPIPRDIDQEFALYMIFNEENDEESELKHTKSLLIQTRIPVRYPFKPLA